MSPRTTCSATLDKVRLNSVFAREFLAELLGTCVLILFGDGSVAQVVLSSELHLDKGSFFTINWGWGVGVTLAVLLAGGVSGAHVNPAVTLAMAVVGKLPWIKVFHYWLAQYLGAFIGASLVHAVYSEALQAVEKATDTYRTVPVTAGIYATYPQEFLSNGGGFLDQVVATALLLLVVSAVGDSKNMKIPSYMAPLYVGFTVLNIGISFGFNCGYAINPARDLAPRIFSAVAGWGPEAFDYHFWWYVPVLGPHVGAIVGAVLYCVLVEMHWPKEGSEEEARTRGKDEIENGHT